MQFKMRPRYTSEKYASTDADDGRIVFSDVELVGLQYRTKLHRAALWPAIFGPPHGRRDLFLKRRVHATKKAVSNRMATWLPRGRHVGCYVAKAGAT